MVWNGDMNFAMSQNSQFAKTFSTFVAKYKLTSAWELYPTDFTHIHTDGISTSTIDHFFVTPGLVNNIESCAALHLGDNLSRHSPIIMKMIIDNSDVRSSSCESMSPRQLGVSH